MSETWKDRLREGFEGASNLAEGGVACPAAERIWESVEGELDRAANEEMLRHLAACGACAASWRLARELLEVEGGRVRELPGTTRSTIRPWWLGLAAAAVVVLVAGFLVVQRLPTAGPPQDPVYRTAPDGKLASEIDPDVALPRDDFVLRWSGAPAGSVYDLRVTTDRLKPLHREFGIENDQSRIPEEALTEVPPGSVLFWTVTAHLPDGGRWTSVTFRATVE